MRTQRFFSPTTMPATDWRASRYSHDPPSRYLVSRAFRTRSARRCVARRGVREASVYRTVTFVVAGSLRSCARLRSGSAARTNLTPAEAA
jgi:hypothetical protein